MTPPVGLLRPFLGRIALSEGAAADAPKTSWIQLFTVGNWWDERYGDFALTRADLAQMLANFRDVTPKAPTKLPIDYNHGTSKPTTAEAGKAAGWVSSLQLRAGGDELWAEVEWTAPAADMIAAKEYQFVSPTFAYDYKHSNGQALGTTLLAAAITNRPVLEGMAPLSLSHPAARVIPPQEIAMNLVTLKDAAGNPIKDAEGKEIKLSAETIAAITASFKPTTTVTADKELSQKVIDLAATVDTLKTSIGTLQTQNTELAGKNAALELARKTDAATVEVNALVRAGKVLPVEVAGLIQLAVKDRETFDLATKNRPVIVKLNGPHGVDGSGDASVQGQIDAAVTAVKTANPKLTHEAAYARALDLNPALYELTQKQ